MLGYIRSLQTTAAAVDKVYSQMGWQSGDKEIVIGNKSYSKSGVRTVDLGEKFKNITDKFSRRGDIAEWSKVANVYNVLGAEEFAFGLMMGMGQLAFKFTGYEGATVNFCGDSGSGKSTILQLIHSIYGIPTGKAILPQDTANARMVVLGCYNNLPVTYDDISNIDTADLSELMYAISNGRDKESLRQDRSLKSNAATWQTVAFCTSNGSVAKRLVNPNGTGSGESYRFMERKVHLTQRYTLNQAQALFSPLQNNYGLAGGLIAHWLVNHAQEAQTLMREYVSTINDKVNATSSERFWVAMCAQAMFGAYIGGVLGIHNYTVEAMLDHSVKVIHELRSGVVSTVRTPIDVLVGYLSTYSHGILIVGSMQGYTSEVLSNPGSNVVARYEVESNKVWIVRRAFNRWCVKHKSNAKAVMSYLEKQGILLGDCVYKSLGEGTDYLTGLEQCYLFNAKHSSLANIAPLNPNLPKQE